MNWTDWVHADLPWRAGALVLSGAAFLVSMALARHKRHRMRQETDFVRRQEHLVCACHLAAAASLVAWVIFALELIALGE